MSFLGMHTSIPSVLWIILDNLFVAFNPNIAAKAVLFRFFIFKRRHFTTTTTTTNHLLLQPLLQMNGKRSRQRTIINIPLSHECHAVLIIFLRMKIRLTSMVDNNDGLVYSIHDDSTAAAIQRLIEAAQRMIRVNKEVNKKSQNKN